jgi:hypothetical protein
MLPAPAHIQETGSSTIFLSYRAGLASLQKFSSAIPRGHDGRPLFSFPLLAELFLNL